MTREDAEKLSVALMQVMGRLDETASFVRDKGDKSYWDQYRHAVGGAMATVALDLAEPLWRRFPELKPESLGGPYKRDPGIYEPRFYDPE
jgi:hypothetical protein